jgi:hypothetical protein
MPPQRLSEDVLRWEKEFSRVRILPSMHSPASPHIATFSVFKCSNLIGLKGTRLYRAIRLLSPFSNR